MAHDSCQPSLTPILELTLTHALTLNLIPPQRIKDKDEDTTRIMMVYLSHLHLDLMHISDTRARTLPLALATLVFPQTRLVHWMVVTILAKGQTRRHSNKRSNYNYGHRYEIFMVAMLV